MCVWRVCVLERGVLLCFSAPAWPYSPFHHMNLAQPWTPLPLVSLESTQNTHYITTNRYPKVCPGGCVQYDSNACSLLVVPRVKTGHSACLCGMCRCLDRGTRPCYMPCAVRMTYGLLLSFSEIKNMSGSTHPASLPYWKWWFAPRRECPLQA